MYHSEGHPNLTDAKSPRTKAVVSAYKKSKPVGGRDGKSTRPRQSVTNLDVSEFIVKNDIKSLQQLLAVAQERKDDGLFDIAQFVVKKSKKSLNYLLYVIWVMRGAAEEIKRSKLSRMQMIRDATSKICEPGCEKQWLTMVLEVLQFNDINSFAFAAAFRESFLRGRAKHVNITIIGPTNCGKPFLLKPLVKISRVFSNPADDKYAWVGADLANIILFQDFRDSRNLISWKDLPHLLEEEYSQVTCSKKNRFATRQ